MFFFSSYTTTIVELHNVTMQASISQTIQRGLMPHCLHDDVLLGPIADHTQPEQKRATAAPPTADHTEPEQKTTTTPPPVVPLNGTHWLHCLTLLDPETIQTALIDDQKHSTPDRVRIWLISNHGTLRSFVYLTPLRRGSHPSQTIVTNTQNHPQILSVHTNPT